MKRFYTLLLALFIVTSLSAQLRIVSVNPVTNDITLKNYGADDLDVSMYRLCSLFDYEDLNQVQVTIVDGDMMLSQDEEVTINWAAGSGMDEMGADLALYIPGGMFSNPDDMVDFVQWGSAGNGRENEADEAGLWTIGTFITGDAPYTFTGSAFQHGVGFWESFVAQETSIVINELDADQEGTDMFEFIELFGEANEALDGLVLVFYNGNNDQSYSAFDLDGYTLDENGFFVIGNVDVENVDIVIDSNGIQNGADGAALYFGDADDFPGNTMVTTDNLIDAIVYGTGDPDDEGLLVLLNADQPQVDENSNEMGQQQSNARIPDGGTQRNTDTYVQQAPTPGCPNETGCPQSEDPTASFSVSSQSVEEGDLVTVTVEMINSEDAYQVDVVHIGGTATVIDDYEDVFTTYLDFPEGSNEPQSMTFMITDDMDVEGEETIELFLMTCEFGLMIGQDSQVITIAASDQVIPVLDIADVVTLDADGVVDSLGVECELRGVVYGVNMRPSGIQFTMMDETDGIGVFSFDENFGYTVAEGDSVHVVGTVEQFNGLTQIEPSSIELISSDNDLQDAETVTALDEYSESNLITLACVSIVDPTDWTNDGSGFNVDVTDGTNTYAMRIDADVDLYGTTAPDGVFSVTGIGGQYDSSSPYDEGYQVLPRYMADITESVTANFSHTTISGGDTGQDIDVEFSYDGVGAVDFAWEFGDGGTSDEENPTYTFPWSFVEGAGFTTSAILTVTDEFGCTSTMTVSDVDIAWEGIGEITAESFSFYPNPVNSNLNIKGENIIDELRIYDLVGQLVVSENVNAASTQMDLSNLVAGAYFLTILTEGQEVTKAFVKE